MGDERTMAPAARSLGDDPATTPSIDQSENDPSSSLSKIIDWPMQTCESSALNVQNLLAPSKKEELHKATDAPTTSQDIVLQSITTSANNNTINAPTGLNPGFALEPRGSRVAQLETNKCVATPPFADQPLTSFSRVVGTPRPKRNTRSHASVLRPPGPSFTSNGNCPASEVSATESHQQGGMVATPGVSQASTGRIATPHPKRNTRANATPCTNPRPSVNISDNDDVAVAPVAGNPATTFERVGTPHPMQVTQSYASALQSGQSMVGFANDQALKVSFAASPQQNEAATPGFGQSSSTGRIATPHPKRNTRASATPSNSRTSARLHNNNNQSVAVAPVAGNSVTSFVRVGTPHPNRVTRSYAAALRSGKSAAACSPHYAAPKVSFAVSPELNMAETHVVSQASSTGRIATPHPKRNTRANATPSNYHTRVHINYNNDVAMAPVTGNTVTSFGRVGTPHPSRVTRSYASALQAGESGAACSADSAAPKVSFADFPELKVSATHGVRQTSSSGRIATPHPKWSTNISVNIAATTVNDQEWSPESGTTPRRVARASVGVRAVRVSGMPDLSPMKSPMSPLRFDYPLQMESGNLNLSPSPLKQYLALMGQPIVTTPQGHSHPKSTSPGHRLFLYGGTAQKVCQICCGLMAESKGTLACYTCSDAVKDLVEGLSACGLEGEQAQDTDVVSKNLFDPPISLESTHSMGGIALTSPPKSGLKHDVVVGNRNLFEDLAFNDFQSFPKLTRSPNKHCKDPRGCELNGFTVYVAVYQPRGNYEYEGVQHFDTTWPTLEMAHTRMLFLYMAKTGWKLRKSDLTQFETDDAGPKQYMVFLETAEYWVVSCLPDKEFQIPSVTWEKQASNLSQRHDSRVITSKTRPIGAVANCNGTPEQRGRARRRYSLRLRTPVKKSNQ